MRPARSSRCASAGIFTATVRADGDDAIVAHEDRAVLDHLSRVVHRHDACAGERHDAARLVGRPRNAEVRNDFTVGFFRLVAREQLRHFRVIQRRGKCPRQRVAVDPVDVGAADVAGAPLRNGFRLQRKVDRASRRHRYDIDVVVLDERQPLAGRRQLEVVGVVGACVHVAVLPVRIHAHELVRRLAFLRRTLVRSEVDAALVADEMRLAAVIGQSHGGAAVDGEAIDAGIRRPRRRGESPARRALDDDRLAIRAEARTLVVARLLRHCARASAARADDMNFAESSVGPANECDALAVARPRREQLERCSFIAREAARRAFGDAPQPQASERFEDHLLAVRRNGREARHARLHFIRRDRDVEARRDQRRARVLDVERDVAHRAAKRRRCA